jgi:pyochelin biosynthetic protein PchC
VPLRNWFRLVPARERARLRLVCFPHAGGSASFFRSWGRYLPDTVELAAVCYPGREDRICDPLPERMEDLAAPLAAACASLPDLPTVFFGHSMGASVAYETALRLECGYGIGLAALCVSGRSAPGSGRQRAFLPDDDDALGRALIQLGGTDVAALLNSELRELVLPVIRADYRLIGRYDARASARPVSAPLIAYYGVADEDLDERSVGAWAALTRACFTLRAMPGGHFYLSDDTAGLVHGLMAQVSPAGLRDPAIAR